MNVENQYRLFLDLDGVLVDFDSGVADITGFMPSEMSPRQMWPRLAKSPDFYDRLDWMPDGKDLWNFSKPYDPIILTGLPMGSWAEGQKRSWCHRELGQDVEVITCMTRQKAEKAIERSTGLVPVLVDDRIKIREAWENAGGVFILHTSAAQSIEELKRLGF